MMEPQKATITATPAKAGIHNWLKKLDSGYRIEFGTGPAGMTPGAASFVFFHSTFDVGRSMFILFIQFSTVLSAHE
jgi:hypothetical protein